MFRLDCAGNGYDERIYRYGRASCGQLPGGIYCRLSKDDDLDGESASIANQRAMLENYCEKQDGRLWQSIRTMATRG